MDHSTTFPRWTTASTTGTQAFLLSTRPSLSPALPSFDHRGSRMTYWLHTTPPSISFFTAVKTVALSQGFTSFASFTPDMVAGNIRRAGKCSARDPDGASYPHLKLQLQARLTSSSWQSCSTPSVGIFEF